MKIGLFGGTFDPVHIGHLVAARLAKEALGLDRIILIPSGVPPHKLDRKITNGEKRLQMLVLAIESERDFQISDWELFKQGPSYTVETLEYFAAQYPEDDLYFIMGADMLCDLPNWSHPERILELAQIIGMARPGFGLKECRLALRQTLSAADSRIHYVDIPELEISSTWLRQRLQDRMTVKYLIPDQVIRFIEENGLYANRTD